MSAAYDAIGIDYARLRQPDPRITAQIEAALGEARTVLNVGAGTGSYEPVGRDVTALEPSAEMIRQRPSGSAPVVQGSAEALPFADKSFDAVMAVLTIHHWTDPTKGLSELRRVSRGPVVILTYDPAFRGFWLADDYLPGLATLDDERMPPLSLYGEVIGPIEITPVPIPHDCIDGFLCAYWRRPDAYLDPRLRAAMSSFHLIGDVSEGIAKLASDLDSGAWGKRHGYLLSEAEHDFGYRLIVAR
jgi:SAM-dependent methyltransferase